jgi:hypothetical protein
MGSKMRQNHTIIADAHRQAERRAALIVFAIAAIAGSLAARHYWRLDLTLSHYDARSHLVVARRTIDSLTPSWRQLGAVWLPLPHLLNALPVQIDWNFRTGFSGVAISILAFAWGLAIVGTWIILKVCDAVTGVRADEQSEIEGLDLSMHGEEGYNFEA